MEAEVTLLSPVSQAGLEITDITGLCVLAGVKPSPHILRDCLTLLQD